MTVLFGGDASYYGAQQDTWEWDGNRWMQRSDIGPLPRYGHAMAYDVGRNRIVLYGGASQYTTFGDTWEWDGRDWRQTASGLPSPRWGHGVSYHEAAAMLLLFGGYIDNQVFFGETWAHRAGAPVRLGDLNCDGAVTFDDINPFVLALCNDFGLAYYSAYPTCNRLNGDLNLDCALTFADINPFVAALTGQ
ncbi:MAG: hypothetical protein AB1716_12705 [Planctomycetota bacterium]